MVEMNADGEAVRVKHSHRTTKNNTNPWPFVLFFSFSVSIFPVLVHTCQAKACKDLDGDLCSRCDALIYPYDCRQTRTSLILGVGNGPGEWTYLRQNQCGVSCAKAMSFFQRPLRQSVADPRLKLAKTCVTREGESERWLHATTACEGCHGCSVPCP